MAIKVPEFKKCCFCVPLRYGLLAWGYIKLVALIVLLAFLIFYVSRKYGLYMNTNEILELGFVITEVIFCVVFIIGAHMKNFNFLRIYYYYTIVEVVMAFIAYGIFIMFDLSYRAKFQRQLSEYMAIYIILAIVCLIIEMYVILLLRSEILKLDSDRCFEFINTEEGESTLTQNIREKMGQEMNATEDQNSNDLMNSNKENYE